MNLRSRTKPELRLVPEQGSPAPLALLAGMRAGDAAAAVATFRRYAPLVRRVLMFTLGSTIDVDDLVQDTFERLFERLDRVESEEKVQAFLTGIAANVAREERKRRRVRRILQFGYDGHREDENTLVAPSADLDAREAVRRLCEVLNELNADDRAAFVLRFVEGQELTFVAEALVMSLATVKRRLARAQQRVVRKIQKDPWLGSFVEGWSGRFLNASDR